MAYPMPIIPADRWNEVIGTLARKLALQFFSRSDGAGFRHPWQTSLAWMPERGEWAANVYPGYVNARETEGPMMSSKDAPELSRARQPFATQLRPWLSESPWMGIPAVRWRSIGEDADAAFETEAVPRFFQALGVGAPPELSLRAEYQGITISAPLPTDDPEERRLLRAVDLVLSVPKPAPSLVPVAGESGASALSVTLDIPSAADLPSLGIFRKWVPPVPAETTIEQIATGLISERRVESLVSRAYLLSPPGEASGSEPDERWIPFAEGHLYYNRRFAYRAAVEELPPLELFFSTGLAFGLADPTFAALLSPVNQGDASAAAILSRAEVKTSAWSA